MNAVDVVPVAWGLTNADHEGKFSEGTSFLPFIQDIGSEPIVELGGSYRTIHLPQVKAERAKYGCAAAVLAADIKPWAFLARSD